MLKCKHCNKSDLGVNLIRTTKDPVRLLDGEVTSVLGAQEVIEEIEYCFCNTCKKAITKKDLYEHIECPVCNRQVDKLVDGKCSECNKVSKQMESFTKDDLISMLIKQQLQIDQIQASLSGKKKEIKKAKEEVLKEKKVSENITKLKETDDDDILSKIENLETEGINFDDDEIELDE